MSTALRCAGLGHRYGRGIWGLRDCNLDVPAGSVVALVGPNGSGKTTLMSMAAGLLPASTGTVEAVGGAPAQRLGRIGFVAQDAPLWPRLRVADVLEIGRCMNGGFDTVLASERIQRLAIRPRARISALSGGERAQVALTLVLAKKPELFLLDEPMANLDPLARRDFLGSMFEACTETGATVLAGGPKGTHEQGLDGLLVQPGAARLGQPPLQVAAQRPVRGQRAAAQRPGHERPDPGPGRRQALVFQLPVGLEHGVRIDRQPGRHVFDLRQLIALAQQAQPQRLPDLMDQLQVRRDARPAVQVELDHRSLTLPR
jgi:ABC-type Mn2+/Zn2+ transport system ATPase subunit